MSRSICVHAHFYQPPRENPWLEEIEVQDSAYPHHDWNQRICAECYAPNTASRILAPDNKILDIVNNYAQISFDFGPTLLSWLARHEPEVYEAILEADRVGYERFSGHGCALAQVYNHMIMPLANTRDKRTQVIWAIQDFEYRFKRKPEGMWLAEAAVDMETLELLAEHGIKLTILAPHQALNVRKIGTQEWSDVSNGTIDPKMPYVCNLKSGETITIFFYDGPISRDIAFGDVLSKGDVFAERLMDAFVARDDAQLVHVATDGETYGHHRRFGDMALAYCLCNIESQHLADITIYGEYLEKNPPTHEVQISENSSWSCIHGIERWRENCGCNSGMHTGWHQEWRAPLRYAMDWLRDSLSSVYEEEMRLFVDDPWRVRNAYIEVLLDRSSEATERFLSKYSQHTLSQEEKVKLLKLLEMQRHAILMYTSCGWFFDDISGIESVQIMHYAARTMQLAKEVAGIDLEPTYIKILEYAPSNIPQFAHGAHVFTMFVKPAELDLLRVGAHYAIASLFNEHVETTKIYCYTAKSMFYDCAEMGAQKFAVGKACVRSDITYEEAVISFAVMHLGDHNVIGGIRTFETIHEEIKDVFLRGDISEAISLIEQHFGTHYSLWHLFKDEQRKILLQIMEPTLKEIETAFRQIYNHHYPIMQMMSEMKILPPRALTFTERFIYDTDLRKLLEREDTDPKQLEKVVDNVKRRSIELDTLTIGYVASGVCSKLMTKLSTSPENLALLESIETTLRILSSLPLQLDLWKAQNIYLSISRTTCKEMQEKAAREDPTAIQWLEHFFDLGNYLRV